MEPSNFEEGFLESTKALVRGVMGGAAGIVLKPLQGARAEGLQGALKGVGYGLLGAVVKPGAGVFEAFGLFSLGLKNQAGKTTGRVFPLRLPRYFPTLSLGRSSASRGGFFVPYSSREAAGRRPAQRTAATHNRR